MSTPQYLSDEDFAEYFLASNHVAPGEDVLDIEPRVEAWLSRNNMGHRSAFAIAVQVTKIAKPRVPTPEEAARLHDLHEGLSNTQPLTDDLLAARVADMAEFARERERLGVYKSTTDFLGGTR
jgi:hypothetical protein